MLKQLTLANIILVDEARIPFHPGLNVISGESGSGKSALMNALKLLQGAKSDPLLIRKGESQGFVEALFDLDEKTAALIHPLLQQAGLDFDPEEELLIRRVIFSQGKSRAFVNNQHAQAHVLRQMAPHLFEMVGQHASQSLMDEDLHRDLLDQFALLDPLKQAFRAAYQQESILKKELEALLHNEPKRQREMETLLMQIEEIESAKLKEGEEEELFLEYKTLANFEEIDQLSEEFLGALKNALTQIKRQKSTLKQLAELDPTHFESSPKSFESALLELDDIVYHIERVQSSSHSDPNRLNQLNERLTLLAKLKKKYGASLSDIAQFLLESKNQLQELEMREDKISSLEEELKEKALISDNLSEQLSQKRGEFSAPFAKAVTAELQQLNMAKAEFFVRQQRQPRSLKGDDHIAFFIAPNPGESTVPLKEAASGGEMARVLFALKTLLSGQTPSTLILDEIDANIGGKTAAVFGEKLDQIGQKRQVLCITHFPQVAKRAAHHLAICKVEEQGRTKTVVTPLSDQERAHEIARMLGGTP